MQGDLSSEALDEKGELEEGEPVIKKTKLDTEPKLDSDGENVGEPEADAGLNQTVSIQQIYFFANFWFAYVSGICKNNLKIVCFCTYTWCFSF